MDLESSERFGLVQQQEPELAEKVKLFWGSADFNEFILTLLKGSGSETARRGYATAVAQAVVGLIEEHEASFPQFAPPGGPATLEGNEHFRVVSARFPRIAANLVLFWRCADFNDFVFNLLSDCRDGTRKGFPPEVARALVDLTHDHDAAYGPQPPENDELAEVIPPKLRASKLAYKPK
jgi:hypothetical protein